MNKIIFPLSFIVPILLFFLLGDYTIAFIVAIILPIAVFYVKRIDARQAGGAFFIFIIFSMGWFFYYSPSSFIAQNQGTVLSDNWFAALNWINENTEECSVVATYWDPGHFITGVAERSVVFDGASQGASRTVKLDGEDVTTSRIQDIATTFFTENETVAMNILKKYRKPCGEMYYIASSDLIGKSVWWSYFSTWDPVDKGNQYSYGLLNLAQSRPLIGQDATVYVYPFGDQQQIVIRDEGGVLTPFIQQGTQLAQIQRLIAFSSDGTGTIRTFDDAEVSGTVWLDPSRRTLVFMPPELENSMFTQLYFFNGINTEHFEFVNNWGGEVKLFKVIFDDTPQDATFLGQELECCTDSQ